MLVTQFLESLMKFIDNLNITESDICSKPSLYSRSPRSFISK